jgi:prophage antirepressor-like protein
MMELFRRSPRRAQQDSTQGSLVVKQFNSLDIPIYGTYEEPLFKAKAIGDLLDIRDIKSTLRDFDKDEVHTVPLKDSLGRNQETNMLTEQGLYKILMISRKPMAKQFQKWVFSVIKEIRLTGKYDHLEQQLNEKNLLLEQKEAELRKYKEITYEEVEKNGHLYILSTDKQGIYKCGRSKNAVNKRVKGLQTACVDDIEILYDFLTSNDSLLESTVHYVLDRYRTNSNREHFHCDIEYMKTVIQIVGRTLDTLKSSYHTISREEIVQKLQEQGLCNTIPSQPVNQETKEPPPSYIKDKIYKCYIISNTFAYKQGLDKHLREKRCKSDMLKDLFKLNGFLLNNCPN